MLQKIRCDHSISDEGEQKAKRLAVNRLRTAIQHVYDLGDPVSSKVPFTLAFHHLAAKSSGKIPFICI